MTPAQQILTAPRGQYENLSEEVRAKMTREEYEALRAERSYRRAATVPPPPPESPPADVDDIEVSARIFQSEDLSSDLTRDS